MKRERLLKIYKKNIKKIIVLFFILIFIIWVFSEIFMFFEKINKEDINLNSMVWSQSCDGKNYTIEEIENFCKKCLNKSGKCEWPLDINISIKKLNRVLNTGGEIHCYFIVDEINEYYEKGRYYGITTHSFFTWYVLDASKDHKIEICCGIERKTIATLILGIEKKWPQSCIKEEVKKICE